MVEQVYYSDYANYRITFIIEKDSKYLFLFVHDTKDDFILIKKELNIFKEEFLKSFKNIIEQKIDSNSLNKFNLIVDLIQNEIPAVISLVGYDGVGKTTIADLIRSKEIPIKAAPKIAGNIAFLKIGRLRFILKDFTGDQNAGFLWNNFIRGSDFILLVTNSTQNNVEKSSFFLSRIREEAPNAIVIVIGNKQDLEDTLKPQKIEEILKLKTYGLIAINPVNRNKLIEIVMNIMQMQDITTPLLSLSNEREILIKQFDNILIQNDLERAETLYKKIVKICLDLGDNPLNMDFYKSFQEIQHRLKTVGTKQELIEPSFKAQDKQFKSIRSLEGRLKTLLINYIKSLEGVLTVIVSDREGFIITSESKSEEVDESILGAIAVMMDGYIERIKREFGEKTTFFNVTTIQEKKFAYGSMGPRSILLTVSDLSTNDTELRIFTEYVAGKVELLLEGNDNVLLDIPEIIRLLSKTESGVLPTGDYSLKLILVGDFAVGKTSLVRRFMQDQFKEGYHSTVGVDISQKMVNLEENTRVKFVIWDIGGQLPKMAPYRKNFYEEANCAFIVIDRTRMDSLNNVDSWYHELKNYIGNEINVILVANKSDLVDKIVVGEDDIRRVSNRYGLDYIITSAKTGECVNEMFLYIAYKYLASLF
ncbi:MAG: ADP-ribosylation factor-like protein [Candidatus Thorarchaeota archaeon]